MWLRDILPLDFPNFRVLTWGYESDLQDNTAASSIADFSRQLLTAVDTARAEDGSNVISPSLNYVQATSNRNREETGH